MTPWQLAKDSEHSHQRALFAWANCVAHHGFEIASDERGYSATTRHQFGRVSEPVSDLAFMFAIPNGGKRDAITAAKLKAEGVKPGVPDILLPVNSDGLCGLFIEMKKPSQKPKRTGAGGVRETQSEYHKFLTYQGYAVRTCYSWLEAAKEITEYLNGR